MAKPHLVADTAKIEASRHGAAAVTAGDRATGEPALFAAATGTGA